MAIPFFHVKGYTANDPLDKAPKLVRFAIVSGVNLVLSIGLLYLITENKVVRFNGFSVGGMEFSPLATMVLEVVINCFVYAPIIVLLRKASSVYIYLVVLLPYFLLDLFIEHHYRADGRPDLALWNYYESSIVSGIHPPALRFFCTLSVDALLFGVAALFLSRVLAKILYRSKDYPRQPTKEEYNALFKKEWKDEPVDKPKRGLGFWVLRILGLGYFAYLGILLVGLLGSSPWPKQMGDLIDMTYANPALAINTYFKIGLMIMLTFIAAYNRKLRYYACLGLLIGHLISTVYSLVFYFFPSSPLPKPEIHNFLLVSGIVDGVMIVIFIIIMWHCRKERFAFAPENDYPASFSTPLSLQNILFKLLAIVFTCITLTIILVRLLADPRQGIGAVFGYPDPMVGNTVTLYGTLALYYFLLIGRRKLRQHFFNPMVAPLFFGCAVALLWIIIGDIYGKVEIETRSYILDGEIKQDKVEAYWYFVLFAAFNMLVSFLLIAARNFIFRIDYAVNSLNPSGAVTVMALANAWFDADPQQQSQVLKLLDQYAGGIRGRRRGLLNLPFSLFENLLNFLYGFRPAFSSMSKEEQCYFIKRYFLREEPERKKAMLPFLSESAYGIGLSLSTIISFAYYSTPNARKCIGYVPVDARDRTQGDAALYNPPHKTIAPLPQNHTDPANYATPFSGRKVAPRVTTPVDEPKVPDEVDFLIIGSGAGGGTMAYRLAQERGKKDKILVVERGHRYQPLQDFSDNEMDMMRKIYKEGGLQQTKRFTMTVLQGECVGGTTVSNNAICFEMPLSKRQNWQNTFGIPLDELDNEYNQIQTELNIHDLEDTGVNTNVADAFKAAINGYNGSAPADQQLNVTNRLKVNHLYTVGDGNWNLGNKRMLKRSMLETYLPWAEANGASIISNMSAVRFFSENDKTVNSVVLRTDNGELKKVKVKKAVIVAGGVIASSHFLMRSGIKHLPVGQGMSCNFGFPVAFDFNREMKAYDGEQITMAALDPADRVMFETYFNPPSSFALASMPFFFGRRQAWMKRYAHLVNFGSLIGSEPNGKINLKASLLSGQAFDWEFGATDVNNIHFALTTLLQLGLHAGAERAVLPTKPGLEIRLTKNEIENFSAALKNYPLRMADVFTGTGHPQGGNLMSAFDYKPRVVDENFRVVGYDNLYVADASVFPTSITANPQWTVMALSSMASQKVLAAHS